MTAFYLAATASSAQEIWIETSWTCADWASARNEKSAYPLEQHLVGLLNGVVMTSGKDFWRLGGPIDDQQAFYWMDRYCAENPLGFLAMGGLALVAERLGEGWNAPTQ